MSKRSRIVGFGSAALLVVAGIACAFAFSGGLGQNLAFALVALGLVEGTALIFYEVGLTEDHDRERHPVYTEPVATEPGSTEPGSTEPESLPESGPESGAERPKDQPRTGPPKPHPPEGSGRVRIERMRGRPRRLR